MNKILENELVAKYMHLIHWDVEHFYETDEERIATLLHVAINLLGNIVTRHALPEHAAGMGKDVIELVQQWFDTHETKKKEIK